LIELLRACSLLKYPAIEDLASKMVSFGPKHKQKLLILDMDETMLHTKFEVNTSGNETPQGLQVVNGVLEFTAFLLVSPEESGNCKDKSLKLNVKIR